MIKSYLGLVGETIVCFGLGFIAVIVLSLAGAGQNLSVGIGLFVGIILLLATRIRRVARGDFPYNIFHT